MTASDRFRTHALIAAHTLGTVLPGEAGRRHARSCEKNRGKLLWDVAETAFLERLATLAPGSLCIDLGANVGVFTEQMADTGADVIAFEPDPFAFELLSRRVGDRANVTLRHEAAGTEDGTLTMYRTPGFSDSPELQTQGTTAFPNFADAEDVESFDIPVVDFCAMLRGLERPVDIVKVDIEGSEVPLLERLIDAPEFRSIRALFVETHERQNPALGPRIEALRDRLAGSSDPFVSLDWR